MTYRVNHYRSQARHTRIKTNEDKHFLTKPYTAGTLLKTLRTILEEP
jgi:hypothetical protein